MSNTVVPVRNDQQDAGIRAQAEAIEAAHGGTPIAEIPDADLTVNERAIKQQMARMDRDTMSVGPGSAGAAGPWAGIRSQLRPDLPFTLDKVRDNVRRWWAKV